MANTHTFSPKIGKAIRWLGRCLSILIILFWGFFFVLDIFGSETPDSRPLNGQDYLQLLLMSAWFIGLILSWKRELIGGIVVITAFVVFGFVNNAAFVFSFPAIPVTGFLFVLSWRMNKPSEQLSA